MLLIFSWDKLTVYVENVQWNEFRGGCEPNILDIWFLSRIIFDVWTNIVSSYNGSINIDKVCNLLLTNLGWISKIMENDCVLVKQ